MSMNRGHGGVQASYHLRIYPQLPGIPAQASCCVAASKDSTAAEVVREAVASLCLDSSKSYVLVEVKETGGEEWALDAADAPAHRVLLWPRRAQGEHPREEGHYFLLRELEAPGAPAPAASPPCASAARRLAERGLLPRRPADLDDLCDLPELSEAGLLCSLRQRFLQHKIYTYAGSILVAVNPFKFLPIYNPKYVKMYENQRLGQLEPHVFALADVAFHAMLRKRANQCLVISGESGSGKTQTTNFLIHCLTALSQKGHASGVERTILGAGPVLEAFGNAKTAHNNNSSRFGKFIQVNYLESGVVRGAVVEKYLLEKSRLVSQEKDERNYHVFYYLLLGVSEDERRAFRLLQPQDYFYLNQHDLKIEDGEDLKHDFERLKQAMEMVGFLPATKRQIFAVLSAILYLGNVTYKKRASGRDEGLEVGPPEVLDTLSQLLKVKREILVEVLTKRKTVTANDKLILPYSLSEAITARDSMAKSLYSALFDWIVLRINHALLNKKDMEEAVSCLSIGVLDIFGFEDFERNSFEQFCINYANEQLQYYFNQHIFKLEQEEYQSEGISWHHIEYTDNVGCIQLISKKPTGLFYLLDEESNFPHATSQTLLAKFKQQHEDNRYFLGTPVLEPAFIIQHFAGRVKYQIKDFREKNMDYMRPDIVALLRGSDSSFVRQLIGMDPVAVFRWAVLRAAIRSMAVLREAGRLRAERAERAAAATGPQSPPGEPQRVTGTPSEKLYRDLHDEMIQTLKSLPWQGGDPCRLLQTLSRLQRPRAFILKSKGIKPKQTIPKNLLDSKSLRLIISMTLHDRTTKSLLHLHKKKKPPSISAQFQASLNKLLETLGKAEPFFIRCIRSNAEKKELCFDEELVLQQLRYTGMLETVRIRRSGYSAKYTFQDFTKQFQALLPKDAQPCREVIAALLQKMDMAPGSYQIGRTKVFLKEAQRQVLQETLHQEVVRRILLLQRWFRTLLERRRFLALRRAAVTIQAYWRSYRTRRALQRVQAAVFLQATWRGYRQRSAYLRQRRSVIRLQSLCRGHLQRRSFRQMVAEKREAEVEHVPGPLQEEVTRPEAEPSDEAPTESPQPEPEAKVPSLSEVPAAPKPALDSHEKVASNREKRESRRQRGLEHVKFQNKHVQATREPAARARSGDTEAGPERGDVAAVGAKSSGAVSGGLSSELDSPTEPENRAQVAVLADSDLDLPAKVEDRDRIPTGASSGLDSASAPAPGSPVSRETSRVPLERPTSLALDVRGGPPEVPGEKEKPGSSPGAREQPESPSSGGGVCQIQRYRDQDAERLASAVELWRGKKRAASSTVLSQSLDLGPRGAEVPGSPKQERRPSLPAGDVAKVLPSLTQHRGQPPVESLDGDPGSKRHTQKKKSSDAAAGSPDAGLSAGSPADSKSTFKRLFLHKSKDKKYSLESAEEAEGAGSTHGPLEATAKKNLEGALEKPAKEPGGKGRKSRALKVGRITVSERWRESVFRQITNANELKFLDEFLLNKVNDLCSQKTPIESLFIEATERFRSNLKTMYSVPNGKIHVGYKDLMENYHIVVSSLAAERGEKDPNLVLNLFQSLLDEFTRGHTKSDFEPPKSKAQKKKRKQERSVQQHNGHVFASYQVNIPQSCEQCLSFIWLMDKALLCSVCKMTCHKKCVPRIQTYCSYTSGSKAEPGAEPGHFGVCVDSLTSDKASVPVVLEKLLEHVEMHGLYTEGLYRKSGAANRTRELRQALQTDPTTVQLENFPIHAITGVLKQWLRELPEPLMTFAQYSDFLRAVELPEKQEQLAAIYAVLEHLPEANHKSLERLVFHLVKVALLEDVNRMSPSALAIIFAPCLLRCPDNSDPLTSMKDVLKVTACVEMLIKEQMRKYKVKMEEINQLEAAESIAFRRLSFLRQNSGKSPKARSGGSGGRSPEELGALLEEEAAAGDEDQEKHILIEQIQSIKEEKEDITYRLPELDPRGSDEENVDSETSASTESLLEERTGRSGAGAAEGPPAPGTPCPSTPAPNPFPAAGAPPRRRPSCSLTVRVKTPRRTPVMPTANIKLPPGLASHLAGLAHGAQQAAPVRRREPPARRPDQVHSVYVAPGAHLPAQGPHEPLDTDEPLPGAQRRYSDPPTYCLPPAAGQANG